MIIKPDGLERLGEERIIEEVNSLKLHVSNRVAHIMTEQDIFGMWPDLYGDEFIDRVMEYLLGKMVIFYLVTGDDAIIKILALKKELRSRYGAECFKVQTLIHCSDNAEEFGRESKCFETVKRQEDNSVSVA